MSKGAVVTFILRAKNCEECSAIILNNIVCILTHDGDKLDLPDIDPSADKKELTANLLDEKRYPSYILFDFCGIKPLHNQVRCKLADQYTLYFYNYINSWHTDKLINHCGCRIVFTKSACAMTCRGKIRILTNTRMIGISNTRHFMEYMRIKLDNGEFNKKLGEIGFCKFSSSAETQVSS